MINQSDPKMIMESREAIYIRPCLDELMSKEMAISQVQCHSCSVLNTQVSYSRGPLLIFGR